MKGTNDKILNLILTFLKKLNVRLNGRRSKSYKPILLEKNSKTCYVGDNGS